MATPHPFIPAAPLDPGGEFPLSLGVDLEEGEQDPSITETGDGVIVDLVGAPALNAVPDANDFYANLAEVVDENVLSTVAQKIIEMVDEDLQNRKVWEEKLAKGMEVLGIKSMPDEDRMFDSAAITTFPMLAEACIQFQARAINELIPPEGPTKAKIFGDQTDEMEARRTRVEEHMNYQCMVEDEDYYPSTDRMLFELSLEGARFKKVYRDQARGLNVSEPIATADFIVPSTATSLLQATRYTHRQRISSSEMQRRMDSGLYRQVDLAPPIGEDPEGPIEESKQEALGITPSSLEEDREYVVYETHIEWALKDVEDGSTQHYIFHVEKDSQQVLGLYRNWRPEDKYRRKKVVFVYYPMIPGVGFYAFGYLHLLGDLAMSTTDGVRSMLDSAQFATLPGGFKSKDAKLPGDVRLKAGVWQDTDMTAEELRNCFYTPESKPPAPAMAQLVQLLIEAGQRIMSTTEAMVGDASNTGPVGTTVALIEQGGKIFSAVHKRLHFAQGQELRLRAELNGQFIPEEGYPFKFNGADRVVYRQDYGPEVDIVPVSDPNIFSSTQRIAIAQTTLDLSASAPDLYDRREVHLRMLRAIRVPDPERILPSPPETLSYDPVTENSLALTQKPFRATPEQNHQAHIQVHQALLMQIQQDPTAEPVIPVMIAHIAEHRAMMLIAQFSRAVQFPIPQLGMAPDGQVQKLPPEIENEVAARAAMVVNEIMPPPPSPEGEQANAELQKTQARLEEVQMKAASDLEQLQAKHQGDLETAAAKHQSDMDQLREELAAKYQIEQENRISEDQRHNDKVALENRKLALEERRLENDEMRASEEHSARSEILENDGVTASARAQEATAILQSLATAASTMKAISDQVSTGHAELAKALSEMNKSIAELSSKKSEPPAKRSIKIKAPSGATYHGEVN